MKDETKHTPGEFEIMADSKSHEIQRWLDTTPNNVARAMFERAALLENAVVLMDAHYDDLGKSNPGFMGKLVLQDYALWNKALLAMREARQAIASVKGVQS